ncbi:hypothetical protein [Blastococcus colisei]|uniref:hypothetical protein n=1 Tax=Blastococcus colisei TaxID=1564162 RepID=UPI001B86403E|nr:hypothetical protein [Blastococcus colisei]
MAVTAEAGGNWTNRWACASSERTAVVLATLADHRIAGGSVYDALVGAAAAEHGLRLISRDRRAFDTYRALDAAVDMID